MWQARRRGRRFFCWSLLVACGQALLGEGRGDGEENREDGEQARHESFLFGRCFNSVLWQETSF